VGRDKDRERSLTSYRHGQNRLNRGRKGSLIYHQSNQSRIMRHKINLKTPSPHPSLLGLNFTSIFLPLPPERHRGTGNGGCGQFITRCLGHSFLLRRRTPHTLPLLQREIPLRGDSSPQTSPKRVLPTGCRSSQTAPAWVSSLGCSPSGTGCSSIGPSWGHKPCQQTCSSMGSSLHGSTGPDRSLLQHGLPTGSQPTSGIHLLQCGVFHGLWVEICSNWSSMGCKGTAYLPMVFIMGCRGKISAPASGAPLPPASALTLVSAELFLSRSLTPLSRLPFSLQFFFFSLLKDVITEALTGLALAGDGSSIEPAGIGSIRHRGSF